MTVSKYIVTAAVIVFVLLLPVDLAEYLHDLKKWKPKMPPAFYRDYRVQWGWRLFSNVLLFLLLCAVFIGIGFWGGPTVNPWGAFVIAVFYTAVVVGRENRYLTRMEKSGYPLRACKAWVVDDVDGAWHRVEYLFGTKTEEHSLLVDGVSVPLPDGRRFDVPVRTGDKECRLVRRGKRVDLAVDGTFMEQGTWCAPEGERDFKTSCGE